MRARSTASTTTRRRATTRRRRSSPGSAPLRSSRRTSLKALAALALAPGVSRGQTYPAKAVKIIVPAQPGGGLDLIGRTIGAELGKALEQQFVIENVGGGGGSI